MMKEKDYRKEIGEKIEEAYLSMPIGDPPSREKFDKWIAIAEQRRKERIRRRRKLASCAAAMLLCVFLGVACIVQPPQVAAGGKGGGKIEQTLETTDVYKSQADLPEEVKEEFLMFPELPEGYEETEAQIQNNKGIKTFSFMSKNESKEELFVEETIALNGETSLSVVESDSIKDIWGDIEVFIKKYNDGTQETVYMFFYKEIFVRINAPTDLEKTQIKEMVKKAVQ